MQYSDYLKTKHWKETRALVLQRTNKCQICGSTKNLNVHHSKYSANEQTILFNERLHHLFVLCSECHGMWHGIFKSKVIRESTIRRIKEVLWLIGDKRRTFEIASYPKESRIIINKFKESFCIKRPTKLFLLDRLSYQKLVGK